MTQSTQRKEDRHVILYFQVHQPRRLRKLGYCWATVRPGIAIPSPVRSLGALALVRQLLTYHDIFVPLHHYAFNNLDSSVRTYVLVEP